MENFDDNDFISFAEVYGRGVATAGAIATEIETNGIHGWDDFGRYKIFPPGTPEATKALEALAYGLRYNERIDQGEYLEPWPGVVFGPDYPPEMIYGWLKKDLPEFAKVEEPVRPKFATAKEESTMLKLLAGALYLAKLNPERLNQDRVKKLRDALNEIGLDADKDTITKYLDRVWNLRNKK